MSRDTCKVPLCDRDPGTQDTDTAYRERLFCSWECGVKYEKLRQDAMDRRIDRDRRADAEVEDV